MFFYLFFFSSSFLLLLCQILRSTSVLSIIPHWLRLNDSKSTHFKRWKCGWALILYLLPNWIGHQRVVKHKDRWLRGPHKRHTERNHNKQHWETQCTKGRHKHSLEARKIYSDALYNDARHNTDASSFCNGAVNKRKKKKQWQALQLWAQLSSSNTQWSILALIAGHWCAVHHVERWPSCSKIAISLLTVKEISCFCLNRNI